MWCTPCISSLFNACLSFEIPPFPALELLFELIFELFSTCLASKNVREIGELGVYKSFGEAEALGLLSYRTCSVRALENKVV